MSKMKTNKAAAKRVKKTGTGKLLRKSPGKRHLAGSKTTKQKRNLRSTKLVDVSDHKRIARLLNG